MEVIFVLAVFFAGVWHVGRFLWRVIRRGAQRVQAATHKRQSLLERKLEQWARRRQRRQRLNQLYRELQIGLLQLDQAPDFRRAASRARVARDVPVALRQRQYRRFRSRLVQHFSLSLRKGIDVSVLMDSLVELLEALGVAEFEADYIRQEATSRQGQRRAAGPTLPARLEQLQREHEQRLSAFQQLRIDADVKEQLLESERQRFQEMMLRLTDQGHPTAESPI
jgi:hypothetical protein